MFANLSVHVYPTNVFGNAIEGNHACYHLCRSTHSHIPKCILVCWSFPAGPRQVILLVDFDIGFDQCGLRVPADFDAKHCLGRDDQ